jgi:Protein of unknown function (DUF2442)
VLPRVISVRPTNGFSIEVEFADGSWRLVDLSGLVGRRPYTRLQEPDFFRQVRVEETIHSIAWPNGVDISPDALHGDAASPGVHVVEAADSVPITVGGRKAADRAAQARA